MDGDRTGHRAAAGKEGDVTIAEFFQRPCATDRPFEDERVRGDVHPGILRERGRPRENVPVIDGEHRRVRRTALAGGKGQGTEAGPVIPGVRGHRRVIQDRDVVEEVHVPLQVNGIRRTAGCRITRIQTHVESYPTRDRIDERAVLDLRTDELHDPPAPEAGRIEGTRRGGIYGRAESRQDDTARIKRTTGQREGSGFISIRSGRTGPRADAIREDGAQDTLVDCDGTGKERSGARARVVPGEGQFAVTGLGQTRGIDRAAQQGRLVEGGSVNSRFADAGGAEDPVIGIKLHTGRTEDDAGGFTGSSD